MTYKARLEIGVDSRGAERDVNRLDDSLEKVERSGNRADKATRKFGKGVKSTAIDLNKLRVAAVGLVGAIGGVAAIRSIVKASDTYTELRSQLRLVTGSQEELNAVWQESYDLANDTRGSLEGTVQLYAKLARSTEELELANKDLFTITKAINQSFVVSGASAQEAEGAIRQLAQGMASGTLRGDELNSVMENSPRLARAIADGLGVTIGELRQLGADGKITAAAITTALLSTAGSIDREFQQMPRTVGQALQQLRNDLLVTFGQTDTSEFVTAIDDLRGVVTDPSFQSSVVTLGASVAKLAGWLGEATTEGVKFTKWAAEELAARYNGVAGDDIVRLEQQAQNIRDTLENPGILNTSDRFRLIGEDGWFEWWSEDELKESLIGIERQIEQARKRQELAGGLLGGGENSVHPGSLSGRLGAAATGPTEVDFKAQEDALQRIIDAAHARTEAFREAAQADRDMRQAGLDALEDVKASLRTEEEEILGSYERRRQIVIENTEHGSAQRRDLLLRLEQETNAQLEQVNMGFWGRYLASAQDALTNMDDIATGTIETFSSGMGSAFERMIFDAQTAREAFQQLGEGMARSIVNALGKMAAEWLAYQAVQLLVGKTTAAAGAAAMVANAQASSAMASLNAFASTAAIPIVGPAAAPGAAAAAAAATAPMVATVAATSFAGSFNGGGYTGNGIRAGGIDGMGGFPAILHPRETVIDHTKDQGAGEQTIVNVHNAPPGSTVRERADNGRRVVDIMIQDVENDGPFFRQLSRRTGVGRVGD